MGKPRQSPHQGTVTGTWIADTKKPCQPKLTGWMRLKVCATDADAEHRQQQYGQHVMPFHNGRAKDQCHAKDEHAKHAYNETD